MEDNLQRILDVDEPVTVEQLEDVVRRSGQRRQATLVAGAAALLALGAVGGAVARGPAEPRPDQIGLGAGRGEASTGGSSLGWDFAASSGGMPGKYAPLFRREANGVAVRAYRVALPQVLVPADPACAGPSSFVQAELSSAAAVSLLLGPEPPEAAEPQGTGLVVLAADSFGVAEGDATTSTVVRAGPGVATVRLTTPSGSDTMAPQDGIAVLAVAGLADGGNVEGLAPDGAVVVTQPIIPPPPVANSVPPPPGGHADSAQVAPTAVTGKQCGSAFSCGPMPTLPARRDSLPPPTTSAAKAPSDTAKAPPDGVEVDAACATTGTAGAPATTVVGPARGVPGGVPVPAVPITPRGTSGPEPAPGATTTVTAPSSASPTSAAP